MIRPQLLKEQITLSSSRYPADKMYWLEYVLSTEKRFIHWIKLSAL